MPKLFLIPNMLTENEENSLPIDITSLASVRHFIVENERSARRSLKKIDPQFPIQECQFFKFDEHVSLEKVKLVLNEWREKDIGIISDAGCPCIADPGSEIVRLAHESNREVVPLVGPSSIILALMSSGLNGQNFAFNGYLPKEKEARRNKIKGLERRSQTERQTQIFMETPYRNAQIFDDVLSCCSPETLFCLAIDLTGSKQFIKTLPINKWRELKFSIPKEPALFLLQKE